MIRSRCCCSPSWLSTKLGWFLLCAGLCMVLAGCGASVASAAETTPAPTAMRTARPTSIATASPTAVVTAAHAITDTPTAIDTPSGEPNTGEPNTLLSPQGVTTRRPRLATVTPAATHFYPSFLVAVATAEAGSDESGNEGSGSVAGAPELLLLPTPTPTVDTSVANSSEKPEASNSDEPEGAAPLSVLEALQQQLPTPEALPPVEIIVPLPTPLYQPTPDGTSRTARVPILMYHYLSVPPAGANIYRQDLSVTPDLFATHLDGMRNAGYTTISLYQLLDYLLLDKPLPEKPVILSFDDGYRDNYENAFPLLRERGMVATFFVVTDFIDLQLPEYLTWDMAREMYRAGMSIESHGRNHVSLKNRDVDYLVWQALGSMETIQYELGVRPRFISYPAGEYDRQTIDIFRSANYWAGVTTIQGATHDSDALFELRRVRVRGTTTLDELLRLLALDW